MDHRPKCKKHNYKISTTQKKNPGDGFGNEFLNRTIKAQATKE